MTKDIVFQAIVQISSGLAVSDLKLLNEGAPNSWTVLDSKNKEVWKIIKSGTYKINESYLEKDALTKVNPNSGVVKYTRDGFLTIPGERKKYPYLIFPYIENAKPLDALLAQRKNRRTAFNLEEVTNVGKQLVGMIKSLFEVGIVHQDIKPGNILVKDNGEIFLVDLGIAMFVDQDLREIKKMKGPYAYLSPEKLDLIADLSDSNKRKLSFPSDLFSAGMILFEMATLKKLPDLMEPGEIRTAYLKLTELGLGENLVEMVSSLLDANVLERQKRAGGFFQTEWFDGKREADADLWLQHASNGIEYLDQFVQEHTFETNWGVIFSADQIQSESNQTTFLERSALVGQHSGKVAVDPCTFRLRFSDEHHSYLVHRDYWQVVSPGIFLTSSLLPKGQKFTEQVMEFQEQFQPDILFSPYFIIENIDDRWVDANFTAFEVAHKIAVQKGYSDKLYFGLFLSEACVLNDKALDVILTQVLLNKKIKNIYLKLESCRNDSEPNKNPLYLQNVKRIIGSLSPCKNLLLGFSDIESLGWLGYGLNAIGINPDYEKRKSRIIEVMTKSRRNIPTPDKKQRYFAQKLLNDVFAQEELRSPQAVTLGSGEIFGCECPFCFIDGQDKRLDSNQVRKHFLWHFDKKAKEMKGKTLEQKKEIFQKHLSTAKDSYAYLETNCAMRFNRSSDGSFIPIWQSIMS